MRLFQLRSCLSFIAGLGTLAIAVCAFGEQSDGIEQHQYEGTLGESRIGMTVVREGNKIQGGHYFYQKYLKDIPITGAVRGSEITLTETGGSVFHLHFVGNGSEGNQPLSFGNSIGMDGTWTSADGNRSYAVSLRGTEIRSGADNGRRYESVTEESDAAFERRVQSLYRAVLSGDKATAVRFISYPLTAYLPDRKMKKLHSTAEVLAAWNDLFTPAMIADLQRDLPHEMFVHNGMAMLGNGEAWFDVRGLAVLNVPAPAPTSSSAAGDTARFQWDWRNRQELDSNQAISKLKELSAAQRTALVNAIGAQLGKQSELEPRVKEVDLNEDGTPEIVAQGSGHETCSPTGNCAFRIFRWSNGRYVALLVGEAQSFTIQPAKTNGFHDIVLGRHASASESELTEYKFDGNSYHRAGCYDANWNYLGSDGQFHDLKEPRIAPCQVR